MSSQNVSPAGAGAQVAYAAEHDAEKKAGGVEFARHFTRKGVSPYDAIEWELRTASITNEKGEVLFEQKGVEIPKTWSQTATNIVVSKYFHGRVGTPEREWSVRQLVGRVVRTMTDWGIRGGYFASDEDARAFEDELAFLLLNQYASFNSPVWFNCGIEAKPQCSACFINSVDDTMESILELAKTEGRLFKWGSGTGSNLSPLRSSRARLSRGGIASGPVSFMKGYDAFAGVIKSGGKTRRAAKMVILNIDHPDIVEFIECKAREEKKAWTLIDAGYDGAVDGEAYTSIFFQNANNSVRVTDAFMKAVEDDGAWETHERGTDEVVDRYKARDLMRRIAESAHVCGDPGMQYDTSINRWHTCKTTAPINASNPCVTGDTLVATAEGWKRIDQMVGTTARVIGADGQPHLVTNIFPTGRKPVFRLRTRAGYQLRVTGDHKVLTRERGDVPVSQLALGEHLSLSGPGFGRRVLAERLALAVGVAVGDGCLTRSQASGRTQEIVILTMSAREAPVLRKIAAALNEEKQLLRAVGSVGRPDDVHVRTTDGSSSRLSFSSRPVVEIFKQFAVLDQGSDRKGFQPEIFELDKPSLAAVLRGLFTSDGTVAHYGEKSQYVSLDSTSPALLAQVQLLLLGFGIKSKIYEERRGGLLSSLLPDGKGGTRPYPVKEIHSLRISRSSRFIFEREIGFDPASPKAAALARMNAEVGSYHDTLEDEIAEIEALGEEEVFDLTETVTHHFVANGIVVHNCSEYMFLDDSACNLASFNLLKFAKPDGGFDVVSFRKAVDVVISAQEFIVSNASYPTPRIEANSHEYRPLGMGYANLGALLMANGLAYDSDAGRDYAAAITAVMTGEAYLQSARIAARLGAFGGYARNREPFLEVIRMHRNAVQGIDAANVPKDLMHAAQESWDLALLEGTVHGFRNAQATVLAPTGTIGFMMDCDTTGVEPDLALVKFKKLVGGGMMKIVNQTVPSALGKLGYAEPQIKAITKFVDDNGTIEGAPFVRPEHLSVFDCAFKAQRGSRSIHYTGHIRMMGAVQPFISGAISKTVNVPEAITVDEIADIYMAAWKLGIKAIAIYRDNSKRTQPLNAAAVEKKEVAPQAVEGKAVRRKLPSERRSITHKFSIGGHEGYITVGMYDDGKPGEIFLVMAKEGSAISGLMDSFATAISLALQYGVPLKVLIDKFSHVRFEPSGHTGNPEVPYAKSIVDYIFRWLASKFLSGDERLRAGVHPVEPAAAATAPAVPAPAEARPQAPAPAALNDIKSMYALDDAPTCAGCGSIMVRNGACYKCMNCGDTSGCS